MTKNQYLGINAHLNSYLQNTPGQWQSFHSAHLVHIADLLDETLPPGYFARVEQSLQIREEALESPQRVRPDITIMSTASTTPASTALTSASGTTTPTVETMDLTEADTLNAVIIYETGDEAAGTPVTRLELLSPTNKPSAAGYLTYRDKRNQALESGLPLIEIDYLHQSRSPLINLPSYPAKEPDATPYYISVSDPRPSVHEGITTTYGFHVDDPFPTVQIPLARQERFTFDFGIAYNHTFARTRFFQQIVDYTQLPLKFATYAPTDQARIRRRMQIIADAVQQDRDLNEGPFTVTED